MQDGDATGELGELPAWSPPCLPAWSWSLSAPCCLMGLCMLSLACMGGWCLELLFLLSHGPFYALVMPCEFERLTAFVEAKQ